MRRMDRYVDDSTQIRASRSNKNQDLYENIGSNTRYTNFTDVTNANAIDLSRTNKNRNTREGYHQMKEYQNVMPMPKVKKELDDFNHLYQDRENKIYDINNVLEEARKNRQEKDALEEKRKLKNTSYNILASLNPEELEKYRKERKDKVTRPNEEELRELIDTITSKTLAGEIDKATSVDLLSDLMATNILDKVEKPKADDETDKSDEKDESTDTDLEDELSLSKEILDKDQLEKMSKLKEKEAEEEVKLTGADTDFYTRSMDLSDKDFEMDDEFKEKKLPLPIKIGLVLILLVVVVITVYFVYQSYIK